MVINFPLHKFPKMDEPPAVYLISACDTTNRDNSRQIPMVVHDRDFNVICMDLKRRCLYPMGTISEHETFFWPRTNRAFHKSLLYINRLTKMEENTINPQTQAHWWCTHGPSDYMALTCHDDDDIPPAPDPPACSQQWSIACYNIVTKSLWHMDSPTNTTVMYEHTTTRNKLIIKGYLHMLKEDWGSNDYLRNPLEYCNPYWCSP